jgi:hypothetical protein
MIAATPTQRVPYKVEKVLHLGGMDWPIPSLSLRQSLKMHGPVQRLLGRVQGGADSLSLTEQDLRDLTDTCFEALQRAHPELSRDQFEDMTVTQIEMLDAFGIIVGMVYPPPPEGR